MKSRSVHHACPRCGYDLSGLVDSWTSECPLQGVCSECGLRYEWRNVLNPMLTVPAWSFEHAISRYLSSLVRSMARSLTPRRLWRDLHLHHPLRPRRLLLMTALAYLLIHIACAATAGYSQWRIGPLGTRLVGRALNDDPTLAIVRAVAWPYSINGPRTISSRGIKDYRHSGFRVADGWIHMGMVWALVLPLTIVLVPDTMRICRVRPIHAVRIGAFVWTAFALALLPFIVLRSIPIIDDVQSYASMSRMRSLVISDPLIDILGETGVTAFVISGCVLAFAWITAVRRYLHLDHALGVSLVQVFIALLIAVMAVGSLPNGALADLPTWIAFGFRR